MYVLVCGRGCVVGVSSMGRKVLQEISCFATLLFTCQIRPYRRATTPQTTPNIAMYTLESR